MAYSDFTPERLRNDFNVTFQGSDLFPQVVSIAPSPWLVEALERANSIGFGSEKSRSERLVTPILLELAKRNQHQFAILSGAYLDIDPARGLNGECDFIFSFTRLQDFVLAPVFCITEAKKQDVEQGTAQCAAQLVGAAQLNERDKKPVSRLYGCSTTGIEWRFLCFENNVFTLDETRYLISDPGKLLGVLQQIVDVTRAQTQPIVAL
ncbi:hypothetical protein MON38_07990 [Hymenobacter sp. DH14]|uniref:Uncharacterized protein n=1 Tax=Hymenobacter cyanobacteriorum TaxID=2926463 RepID=A0A9X2AF09_9BACT|nr:hypothetical protein [Hymenobacter cyanobacteriorum]MCI1187357.1 hypothetical protein [Hymenobacter cyanobacteriorum]